MLALFRIVTIGFLSVGVGMQPAADVVPWLYEISLPVSSQQTSEVNRVSRIGLMTVLNRITGARSVSRDSVIENARQNVQNYVLQHSFSYVQDQLNPSTVSQLATVEFDPSAIRALIRDAGLPLWTSKRPTVLLWLTHFSESGYTSVQGDLHPEQELVQSISEIALARGLEIRWAHLSVPRYGVRNFFEPLLEFGSSYENIASSYQAGVVFSMDVVPFRSYYLLKATIPYGIPGNDVSVDFFDNEVDAFSSGFHTLIDKLADMYGVKSDQRNQIAIQVYNIQSLDAYLNVQRYLANWEFVERVDLSVVSGSSFRFLVQSLSSKEQFLVHLSEDSRFEIQSDKNGDTTISLNYVDN